MHHPSFPVLFASLAAAGLVAPPGSASELAFIVDDDGLPTGRLLLDLAGPVLESGEPFPHTPQDHLSGHIPFSRQILNLPVVFGGRKRIEKTSECCILRDGHAFATEALTEFGHAADRIVICGHSLLGKTLLELSNTALGLRHVQITQTHPDLLEVR